MVGENIIYHLRNKLYRYIQYANISFHDKTPAGTLFVRITSDVEDITTAFKDVATTFIKDAIMIIALACIMLYFNYQLSLVCFVIIPFVILTSFILTKISKKIREISNRAKTELNIFLSESIYGIKLIKIFHRQEEKNKECKEYLQKFYQSRIPIAYTEAVLAFFTMFFKNLGVAIVVWASLYHFLGIDVEIGVIYLFTTYIKQIFEPITNIVEDLETVQEAVVSINKIYEILEHKEYLENLEEGIKLEELKGKIEFKHVWFAYEGENWILKDVSFTIEPGQNIALVGKTGSGKTTIINLVNRFYEIQKGEILLDGVNIKKINLRFLRENIGIVLQDPFIFADTIKKNIELSEILSEQMILETIRLAKAEELIRTLPNGIEEVASERGSSFSAGQKQLIAFARIFAHNPSIFVLDEATANIDTKTEELIQMSIEKISKEKTSIFIAHRLSTIVNVDKILVLSEGRIVEEGSHVELMGKENGYYSKLYRAYYASLAN